MQGRKFVHGNNDTIEFAYTYNSDGLRNSKYVTGTITDYYWLNGTLQAQKTGSEYIVLLHDENGVAYGFLLKNGATEEYYYYVFNVQGDVIGILDSNGTQVVEYTYNPWGEILSVTGTMAETIGQKNPIRYRGYYYDNETGFYYLQSRYYDPVICRFINADGLLSTGTGVLGYNMFTYCNNNPIILVDSGGSRPVVGASIKNETTAERKASCDYMNVNRALPYKFADDAAMAFANATYRACQYILHEYGTVIYSRTINGVTTYGYATPVAGLPHKVNVNNIGIPYGTVRVATAHTHPNGNNFSDNGEGKGDIPNANRRGLDSYVVGPNLWLQRYNVSSNTIDSEVALISPIALTSQQQAALVSQFAISWENHLGTCDRGCNRRTWPNS